MTDAKKMSLGQGLTVAGMVLCLAMVIIQVALATGCSVETVHVDLGARVTTSQQLGEANAQAATGSTPATQPAISPSRSMAKTTRHMTFWGALAAMFGF